MSEIEFFDGARAMVKVESTILRPAVNTAAFRPNTIEDNSVLLHVLVHTCSFLSPPFWVQTHLGISRSLTFLVALPRLGGVVRFSTCHAPSLPYWDTWEVRAALRLETA